MRSPEQKFEAIVLPNESSEKPEKPEERKESPRSPEEPYIVIDEKSVSYLGVEIPKGEGGQLVPKAEEFKEEYFYLEGHYTTMRDVATALLLNKPILLEGGTGVYNKTTTIARMCQNLNMNYCKVNFDRETAREDVIGGHTLKVDENGKEKLEWYDGDLLYAIRNGGIAFLDEYNRQSKLAGVINPIIDAVLNGRKEITNPYNENERVRVHPNLRLVGAQNPPGFEEGHEYAGRGQLSAETFGRWLFRKLPIEYSETEQNKLLAGVIGEKVNVQLPESEFRHTGEGLLVRELAEIPGMTHWRKNIIDIVQVLEAKSSGAKREMAKNQRQNLYFNPRLIMSTIPQYIARFYRGDINETVKNAFETCVIGMYSSETDKQKVRLMLDQASWKPQTAESKRKGPERNKTEPIVAKKHGKEKGVFETPLEQAKEIMGENFYGKEEIETTSGFLIKESDIPPIPYSLDVLKQAKELGESLVLRVSRDGDGNPMTMKRIIEIMEPRMDNDTEGKLIYNVDWYKNEEFYKEASLKTEWRLVGGSFVPDITSEKDEKGKYSKDSRNNNYVRQTGLLREYLRSVDSLTEVEERECSEETLRRLSEQMGVDWDSQKITDNAKYNTNWEDVALKLAELQINVNHRRTPAEIIYDWVLRFKKYKDRSFLENNYDWSNALSSDGYLVHVGYVDSDGARVRRWHPDYRLGYVGVVSLR